MANFHFRNNTLVKIKINGVWISEDKEVKEGVVNAFQSLLLDNFNRRAELDVLSFASLSYGGGKRPGVAFKGGGNFCGLE